MKGPVQHKLHQLQNYDHNQEKYEQNMDVAVFASFGRVQVKHFPSFRFGISMMIFLITTYMSTQY